MLIIFNNINRTFGYTKSKWKDRIRKALEDYNLDEFKLVLDTYGSTLEAEENIKKVNKFWTYILNHWKYILDWPKRLRNSVPHDARGLGAMK